MDTFVRACNITFHEMLCAWQNVWGCMCVFVCSRVDAIGTWSVSHNIWRAHRQILMRAPSNLDACSIKF